MDNPQNILDMLRQMNQKNQPGQVITPGQRFGVLDYANHPAPLLPGARVDSGNPTQPDVFAQQNVPSPGPGMGDVAAAGGKDAPDVDVATPELEEESTYKKEIRKPASKPKTQKEESQGDEEEHPELKYDNDAALKDAQSRANSNRLNVNLLNAGTGAAEALSGAKFDHSVNKSLEEQANQGEQDILEQQKSKKTDLDILDKMYKDASNKALRDPDSDISIATRKMLGELGMNLGKGTSAYDIQQATAIDKLLGIKANSDTRKDIASQSALDRKERNDQKRTDEENKRDQYIWNRTLSSARSDKDISNAVVAANRLQNTLNNLGEKSVISPQDLKELQQLTVAVQGLNGRSGVHEREERYANSLGLKATDLEQFLTGKMQDVGKQNDILQKMQELAKLEVGNFNGNLERRIAFKTAGVGDILKRHHEYQSDLDVLKAAGMDQVVPAKEGASNGNRPTIKVKASDGTVAEIYKDQFLAAQEAAKKNGQTLQMLQ